MMNDDLKNTEQTVIGEDVEETSAEESLEQIDSPEEAEIVETPQEPEPTRESPGVILKREREAQGLSLEIVHEATKIPLDALRAIEEGYTVRMLSPFYYKGFLKMYAGYLGISASEVIEDYRSEELPEHIEKNVEEFDPLPWITNFFTRKRKQQIAIAAGSILALFLMFKMIGFFAKMGSRANTKKDVIKTEAPKKKTIVKKIEKKKVKKVAEKPRVQKQQEVPKIVVPKKVPKVEPKRIAPVPKSAPKPAPSPIVTPAPIVQKNIVLTVRAKQNSWLRVKVDDDIVFQSVLRLGAVETWAADDEIEISGKNVDQLEFEMNGKMIGTLGRKDRNVKKVVITKRGLSVEN